MSLTGKLTEKARSRPAWARLYRQVQQQKGQYGNVFIGSVTFIRAELARRVKLAQQIVDSMPVPGSRGAKP